MSDIHAKVSGPWISLEQIGLMLLEDQIPVIFAFSPEHGAGILEIPPIPGRLHIPFSLSHGLSHEPTLRALYRRMKRIDDSVQLTIAHGAPPAYIQPLRTSGLTLPFPSTNTLSRIRRNEIGVSTQLVRLLDTPDQALAKYLFKHRHPFTIVQFVNGLAIYTHLDRPTIESFRHAGFAPRTVRGIPYGYDQEAGEGG